MELELKKACFDAYEAAGELTLTQEETAETIVPDYCPDIARIIETTGKVSPICPTARSPTSADTSICS